MTAFLTKSSVCFSLKYGSLVFPFRKWLCLVQGEMNIHFRSLTQSFLDSDWFMEYEYFDTFVGSVECKDLLYFPWFLNTVDSFMGFPQFQFISGNCDKSISCVYDYTQFWKGELTSYVVCQGKKKERHLFLFCIQFCLPCMQRFCQNSQPGTYRMPYPLSWWPAQTCFWSGDHFTANEV